jgi:uncharacterized protein
LKEFQKKNNYTCIGDATSDINYKAGIVAAIEEGVFLPFFEAGVEKKDIIDFSKEFGLELKHPESCLATRVPLYTRIERKLIERIRNAEEKIKKLGFSFVRCRAHANLLRIEIMKEEMEKALKKRKEISTIARKEGFGYVALDLEHPKLFS